MHACILVYVLAKLETGTEDEILNSLKGVKEMEKASLTYGVYDLCIQAQFKDMEELDNFLFNIIRKIHGVKETVTLISSRTAFFQPPPAVSFG